MADDLSLVRFGVTNFFAVLMNTRPFQPTATLLIKLVEALISAEPDTEDKNENKARLEWIYEYTHKKVMENIAIVELVVFKNLHKGLNFEVEIHEKEFKLAHLYKYLDEVSKELSQMVISIGKKYSIDIPMNSFQSKGSTKIDFEKQ